MSKKITKWPYVAKLTNSIMCINTFHVFKSCAKFELEEVIKKFFQIALSDATYCDFEITSSPKLVQIGKVQ